MRAAIPTLRGMRKAQMTEPAHLTDDPRTVEYPTVSVVFALVVILLVFGSALYVIGAYLL